MITEIPRDPWRAVWRVAISDGLLIVLLLGIAVGLTLTSWLPQTPGADPATNLVAHAQWSSQTQARFGAATATLQSLGLFTITRSLGFRVLLTLLAGCLLLRLIESGDRLRRNREMIKPAGKWQTLAVLLQPDTMNGLRRQRYRVLNEPPLLQADRWPWADLFPLLTHGGALLLLIGLLITHLWGWQFEGTIVQDDERVTLPGTEQWVALDKDGYSVMHSPGIAAFIEKRGPGVRASASDGTGRPLSLQRATEAAPVTPLTVPLDQDRYFAIPEAQLVVRLAPQPDHGTETLAPVLVQIYRSPPGQLITATTVEGDAELVVDEVQIELTSAPYTQITAAFNPGLWPTSVGLVLLGIGLLGGIAWPARRFWLLEETGEIKGSGDLPPALARREEI